VVNRHEPTRKQKEFRADLHEEQETVRQPQIIREAGSLMKVIGFVASQRKSGNTAWVVEQILEGAKAGGVETEVFYSSELDIKPCKGCLACVQSGKCAVDDDMRTFYAALKTAGGLVLGSPVYMGQMSGQAKVFTDRLFAQITPRFSPRFKEENAGKKLILAFTQGNPDAEMFREYYDYTKKMFGLLEFDFRDLVVVTDTRSEAAHEKQGLRAKIRGVGAMLAGETVNDQPLPLGER
jgi:multimeric flavodoxin WrbA